MIRKLHCLSKHPGDSGDPWRDPTCPCHKAKQAVVLHPNSEGPELQEQPLAELSSLHTCDNTTVQTIPWEATSAWAVPAPPKLCWGALPQQSHVTEHDQNIFCASLSSFWSEVYENWDLSKEPTQIQTCLLFPNPAAQTAVFILLSQNIKLWFPSPLFLSKGRVVALVLFCLVCCSCWHVRGEQYPSYNGFGSWIHCVVTCCSGLSPHFSISLAELQAVQCQKTNYRGIYPVLGLVGCYSALTELAMMDWVRSTACGTIFLALQRDFSSYFWTNALC